MKATFEEYLALNQTIKNWDEALKEAELTGVFPWPYCSVCIQREIGRETITCFAKEESGIKRDCLYVRHFGSPCIETAIHNNAMLSHCDFSVEKREHHIETAIKVLRQIRNDILDEGFLSR